MRQKENASLAVAEIITPYKYNSLVLNAQGGLLLYMWYMGTFHPNGSLFWNKSLNMGHIFSKKISKHGTYFSDWSQILGYSHENFKKWVCISRKIPKNGSIFCKKMGTSFLKFTSEDGLGVQGPSRTPRPKKVPPLRLSVNKSFVIYYIGFVLKHCKFSFSRKVELPM